MISLLIFISTYSFGLNASNDSTLVELTNKLRNEPAGIKSEFFRRGNQTIEMKSFVAIEGTLSAAKKILKDYANYSKWGLENINQSPKGGNYYMKILDLIWKIGEPEVVGVQFLFNFPLFKHAGTRKFQVSHTEDKTFFEIKANNYEQNDPVVQSCEGIVKVFPAPKIKDRLWVYIQGKAVLKSWVLYSALPEKTIGRELGERVYTILLNYQKKEGMDQATPR